MIKTEKQLAANIESLVSHQLTTRLHGVPLLAFDNLHDVVVDAAEAALVRYVLERLGNNQLRAAAVLGINRNTLRSKMRQFGITALPNGRPSNEGGLYDGP